MFGGHEIENVLTAALFADDGGSYCVCPDPQCNHDAAVLNAAYVERKMAAERERCAKICDGMLHARPGLCISEECAARIREA
jgi:hypothetical protein